MTAARAAGATVSIDLASFELVRNCKESLLGILRDGLVDLIFANEEEAITLCAELKLLDEHAGSQQQGQHEASTSAPGGKGGEAEGRASGAATTSVGASSSEATAARAAADADEAVAAAQRFLLSPTGGRCKVWRRCGAVLHGDVHGRTRGSVA
jgi:hypothetical protein